MRVEATVPDTRGAALDEVAAEFGMSRSQVVDEALALFLKAVVEVRRGRRLVTLGLDQREPACELATPTLSALEWATSRQKLKLNAEELAKMAELIESPPKAGARLKSAMKRHK